MQDRTIAGKYRILKEIGRGSMGSIWRAFDENLQRHVAVKLMSPSHIVSPMAKARFEREARAIAKLQSPHVVQVFDAGLDGDTPYIVMEMLAGEDLETRLERTGPMPIQALNKLVDEIAKALTAAHAREIVHRDLKPANIFLATDDAGQETLKILDFGVVAMLAGDDDQRKVTLHGSVVGTPLYMGPEQIRSTDVDNRADLWSFAVILYRAVTGDLPFDSPTIGGLMLEICMDPFPPPSQVLPSLGPHVDAFFEKALAKDADKRFQTAAELASAWHALSSSTESKGAKILIVDDEPQVVRLFRMQFRKQMREGTYQFVFAADGEEALQALREHRDIDVVFTDINMPNMDGLTFLSHLHEANPFARAVVVSAYGDMRNIRAAMNQGAFDFLTKPIDFEDLEATAQKTLRLTTELRKNAKRSEEYSVLRKFVSPGLLRRVENRDAPRMPNAMERTEGTVAFIGISAPKQQRADVMPDDHLRTLNANFEIIVPVIVKHGGVVHEFIGGTAMILFQGDQHETHAIDACLDVRKHLQGIAQRAGGTSPFSAGVSIGIASGSLIIGEIGSNTYDRLGLAVLGEAQAIAMQLQAAAQKDQLLISADMAPTLASAFELLPLEPGIVPTGLNATEILDRATNWQDKLTAQADTVNLSTIDASLPLHLGDSGIRPQNTQDPTHSAAGSSGGS